MSLYQRPSANVGMRSTTATTSTKAQPGSSYVKHVPHSPADRAHAVEEYDTRLLDDLNKANTDLNIANAERDKLKAALELANKKLAETTTLYRELKAQHEGLRNENEVLKEDVRQVNSENERLEFERRDAEQRFIGLSAKHENLTMRYNALNGMTPPAMASPLPDDQPEASDRTERPKTSRPSSKASSGKSTTSSGKTPVKKDREERHREDRHRGDRHREDRHRDKSRTREKERDKEKSDAKADKVRLSKRFDERPAPADRRTSFIEPWGPGGWCPTALATPFPPLHYGAQFSDHYDADTMTGRMQTASVTHSHQGSYANVPRSANLSISGHVSSDSSNFSDDPFEDGNYHPYPIVN